MQRAASAPGMGQRLFGQNGLRPGEEIEKHGMLGAAGAMVAGYSIYAPTQAYAGYENIARHSAITEGLSGPAAEAEAKRLMGVFNHDAIETGQPSEGISHAYQDLIQMGIAPKRAEALLPFHSRAATAYNTTTEAMDPAVFALSDSFKIDETGFAGALASMALASKSGRFKFEDFSHYMPGIGGDFSKLGMTGRGSADIAFASLETVMKNAADPSQGAANFKDFMNAMTSPHSARSFALDSRGMAPETKAMLAKYHVKGINLPKLLEDARHKGIDPLTAVVRTLSSVTAGLPPDVKAEVLGAYLGNQQARDAAQSLISHPDEYKELLNRLHGADTGMLDRDFDTAHAAPKITNDTGAEVGKQLERRVGEGFEPIITRLTDAGKSLLGVIDGLDTKFPGLGDAVLAVTGGMLALVTAMGALGLVAPSVAAGAALLGTAGVAALPFLGPAALVGLAYAGDPKTQVPLMDPYSLPMDSANPHPISLPHGLMNMFNLGGDTQTTSPIQFDIPNSAAEQRNDQPIQLDLTVRTDPGATVTVNGDRPRVTVRHHPDPGPTTNRP
jgi:hypothetical protein